MCRKHLGMTRDEFLYDHDVVGISTMLQMLSGNKETKDESPDEKRGVDFL